MFKGLAVQCQPAFAAQPGLRAAFLFGSVARAQATAASDVDIAVVGRGLDPLALGAMLNPLLGRDVDIVQVDYDSPLPLLRSVLRDGRLLYERAPGQGSDFLARARTVNDLDGPAYDAMMRRFMRRVAKQGVGA